MQSAGSMNVWNLGIGDSHSFPWRLVMGHRGTGTVPAMKPAATATGNTAIWPLENNLNV